MVLVAGMAWLVGFSVAGDECNLPQPDGWPKPAYNLKKHPLSRAKVTLGRRLFYETLLSRDNTISCSSCHLPATAFTHIDHNLSHGIEGKIGVRNSPALMNLAWSKTLMWDGAINHLDEMAQTPITNPLEMDEQMDHVAAKLRAAQGYGEQYRTAFGDSAITGERTMQALAQFMLTLVSTQSKYDKVMAGAATFTAREADGYNVFKAHCGTCHTEPLFTNGGYENNGLEMDSSLSDIGRMKVTHRRSDSLKFKVPTLRNVEVTFPYMHDGRFRNLQMVVLHYSEHVQVGPTLSNKLPGSLKLTGQERGDLVLFLKTLTDEEFLKNKDFLYTQSSAL